jgi:anti-anti-sigma factor
VEFARLPDEIAVVRIVGRCSFQNSGYLEKAADVCERDHGDVRYVLDFQRCESMDSTFLGVLAGIALRQRKRGGGNLIAVNVSAPIRRTMGLLGLTHVLELRDQHPTNVAGGQEVIVSEAHTLDMPRADQVAHMLEAHQTLVELDSGNEVRFENVIKYLGDSLYRARAGEPQSPADPSPEKPSDSPPESHT